MEPKKRTGENEACRENDSLPEIGEAVHESLSGAIAEREYLQNYPKPKYGWSNGIENLIERRIICLNGMIADLVVKERKTENGN